MFVMYQDSDPRHPSTPAARIAAALAAFRARFGAPRLVLVAEGEGAPAEGVEVRTAKAGEGVVRPGVVWVAL